MTRYTRSIIVIIALLFIGSGGMLWYRYRSNTDTNTRPPDTLPFTVPDTVRRVVVSQDDATSAASTSPNVAASGMDARNGYRRSVLRTLAGTSGYLQGGNGTDEYWVANERTYRIVLYDTRGSYTITITLLADEEGLQEQAEMRLAERMHIERDDFCGYPIWIEEKVPNAESTRKVPLERCGTSTPETL